VTQADSRRYAVDILLIQNDRYVLSDATLPRYDGLADTSCGPLTPIPAFESIIDKCYQALRTQSQAENQSVKGKKKASKMTGVKLDGGKSLMCVVDVVADVMRNMCRAIEKGVGLSGAVSPVDVLGIENGVEHGLVQGQGQPDADGVGVNGSGTGSGS
jgi:hypothetical protein